MSDDRQWLGRPERREDASPSSNWHAEEGLFRCLARPVRPYRLVARYRGDRLGRDADLGAWDSLWTLRTGDVSWPGGREN